jgi:hypothetical protein
MAFSMRRLAAHLLLKKLSRRFREDSKSIEKVVTSMVDAEHTSGRLDPCAMDAKRDARYARITAHI